MPMANPPPSMGRTPKHRSLARGASNQDIADALVVATSTVKHHASNILSKLEATNRTQVIARARALGLLSSAPLD
ncbi:response regulator transcription factor [Ktedonobacter robiniae]|uniref:response regulator transcription factor n=1 Tax=Ktedonobacter robiniae TaxID=2778365 RepID=UPI0019162BF0|nr:LuxR C-terminal-related transcriptional regulator [Ktedonobacter robiniae]